MTFSKTSDMREYDFLWDFDYTGVNKQYLIRQDMEALLRAKLIKIGKGKKVIWKDNECNPIYYDEFKRLCEEGRIFWDDPWLYVIDPGDIYEHVKWDREF